MHNKAIWTKKKKNKFGRCWFANKCIIHGHRKLLSTPLKKNIGQWEHRGEIFGTGVTLEDSCKIEERHLLNLDFWLFYKYTTFTKLHCTYFK